MSHQKAGDRIRHSTERRSVGLELVDASNDELQATSPATLPGMYEMAFRAVAFVASRCINVHRLRAIIVHQAPSVVVVHHLARFDQLVTRRAGAAVVAGFETHRIPSDLKARRNRHCHHRNGSQCVPRGL